MAKPLVIVESPAKAKTIAGFLGGQYHVESSIGHIRDLPKSASDIPEAYKQEVWSRLGVDPDNDFKPLYVVSSDKEAQVKKLKSLLKEASELYLATDEDREGESIAWHLLEVLNPRVPVKRMVFHEITKEAIDYAVKNWRELDRRLVDAQEARRILDRLYGYEVSPVLWKKVMPKLSAGRVQSVAIRMIVEREKSRINFVSAAWWDVKAQLESSNGTFFGTVVSVGGKKIAQGRDFDSNGELTKNLILLDESSATLISDFLQESDVKVKVENIEEKPFRRSPAAPFMTSTLQQEAARKLRLSAQRSMRVAQRLYEEGWITYMRTDSVTLSESAIKTARKLAADRFGKDSFPSSPRKYASKVKNAQEAHEAIRPAGEVWIHPDQARHKLSNEEAKLYELIWIRTVASQMNDAKGISVSVKIGASKNGHFESVSQLTKLEKNCEISSTGRVITDPGFLAAYEEGSDDSDNDSDETSQLPRLRTGESLSVLNVDMKSHDTQPPARFTEASLVKALEERGIGRPSTYASIIETIQQRGYVWKKGTALIPFWTAFAVTELLEKHFHKLVDYSFTAHMEDDLDEIANGQNEMVPWLREFYFGNDKEVGLKGLVDSQLGDIDAKAINSIKIGEDEDGEDIVVRVGRFGPYIECGEKRASIPENLAPDELDSKHAIELFSAPSTDRLLGVDPGTGLEIFAKSGRYGPYIQLEDPNAKKSSKPKVVGLFKSMNLESITLDDAISLLSLPRVIGLNPENGVEIVAKNGRYGPYIESGKETRTLETEDELLTITLDQALEQLAKPKVNRWQRQGQATGRVLGEDPETNKPVSVKSGRFGPYVTDGVTNASLRKGDQAEEISMERALELLADRRYALENMPAKAKKTAAKKSTAKKSPAKKTPAKKTAAKKSTANDPTIEEPN